MGGATIRKQHARRQLLAVLNRCNMVSYNVLHASLQFFFFRLIFVKKIKKRKRRRLRRSLREQQAHGTWLTTTVTAHASALPLLAYAHPTQPVHASLYPETRATLAQHNYAHPIMPSSSIGAQHNYLDLEPRTTTQLQGNEMIPRVIHYTGDTVLLFPRLPSLLCLLFYDAFSHHIYVFLFVSVNPAAEK